MLKVTQDRLATLLRPLFPKDAEFRLTNDNSSLRVGIDWRLADPQRPNKRSKLIDLHVSREFVDDYDDGSEGTRNSMERLLIAKVTGWINKFDAEHDAPYGVPPPQEVWTVTSA